MNLATTYLGLPLAHPLIPGASPLSDDLDSVRRLEDAGAAAIVMRSLFEEQLTQESLGAARADRKSKRGFGTMAREVIMCTGARSGDDSGHSITDRR